MPSPSSLGAKIFNPAISWVSRGLLPGFLSFSFWLDRDEQGGYDNRANKGRRDSESNRSFVLDLWRYYRVANQPHY